MRAILQDDNNRIVAYSPIESVNMCNGDHLTVTWKLTFDNSISCAYCGKKMRAEGEDKLIEMTGIGNYYYHLCGLRCKILTALKQAVA